MDISLLIRSAFEARENAYAPYSKFQVGAALLAENGEIFKGCNIENASYGAAICAERTAFVKAVSQGMRKFRAIAIVGKAADADKFEECAPCGICRQFMAEFCDPDTFKIILPTGYEEYKTYTLRELLPLSFTAENLRQNK